MSLGCARCGACCDPVHLEPDQAFKILRYFALRREGEEPWTEPGMNDTFEFAWQHWTERATVPEDGGSEFDCDQFDPATRLCLAGDQRPQVCRDYPFYDAPVMGHGYPQCSYWLDVAPELRPDDSRPLIPIVAVNR